MWRLFSKAFGGSGKGLYIKHGTTSSFLVVLSLSLLLTLCKGQTCPNACSNHGECSNSDLICDCEEGWDYYADCSARTCANASGWSSKAHSTNEAHMNGMECSNRGVCDRASGECKCDVPFGGVACERLSCPNDCSDNGLCMSLYRAGIDHGLDHTAGYSPGGDGVGFYYENWDAHKVQMCFCDWGRVGADCSQKYCPAGDDPVTTGQRYRAIKMTLGLGDAESLTGTVRVGFNGHYFTQNVKPSEVSEADCEGLWESLDNVEDVTCTKSGSAYEITFNAFAIARAENNVFTNHDGNPLLGNFTCDISDVAGTGTPACVFSDVVSTSIVEYVECSNRGLCNYDTGECQCYEGYSGSNCATTYIEATTNVDGDVLLLHSLYDNFEGNLLHLKTDRTASSGFKSIVVESASENTFEISGNGDVNIYKGKLSLADSDGSLNVGGEAAITGAVSLGSSLSVNGATNLKSSLSVSQATNLQSTLKVESGETITSGGLVVTAGGETITDGGLFIAAGGLDILRGGLFVHQAGATIKSGGFKIIAGGETISAGGLVVAGGATKLSSTLSVGDAAVVKNTLSVNGNTKVDGALTLTGIATIGGSLSVVSATNLKDTLSVTGKTNIGSTLSVEGETNLGSTLFVVGDTNLKASLSVFGAANLKSSLAVVGETNLGSTLSVVGNTKLDSTLKVTGTTELSSSLSVDGKTHLGSTLKVESGFTTESGGLYVGDGGATIFKGGLNIKDSGVTIQNGGNLVVDGKVEVEQTLSVKGDTKLKKTLQVAKGETITAGGLKVHEGGVTVTKHGLYITDGGVTIHKGYDSSDVGDLTVEGATELQSTLDVDGAAIFSAGVTSKGVLTAKNNLAVEGATTLEGTLSVNKMTLCKGSVKITDTLSVSSNTFIKGEMKLDDILTVADRVGLSSILSVDGATNLESTLSVGGATFLKSPLSVSGATKLSTSLSVQGQTKLSTVVATGAMALNNNLQVDGNTLIKGTLSVKSDLKIETDETSGSESWTDSQFPGLAVQGVITSTRLLYVRTKFVSTAVISATSGIVVGSTITGTSALHIDGTATLDNTLTVNKQTTFNDHVTIASGKVLNVKGSLSTPEIITTTVAVSGSLSTSAVTAGALTVSGATTLKNDVTITGSKTLTVGGSLSTPTVTTTTLNVAGGMTLNGDVTIASGKDLTVEGSLSTPQIIATTVTVSGSLSTSAVTAGSLTVSGATTLKDDVTITGSKTLTVGGSLSTPTVTTTTLNVAGATTLNNDLSTNGDVSITGTGTLSVGTGGFSLVNTGILTNNGATVLYGSLSVGAINNKVATTFQGSIDVKTSAAVVETLSVGGRTTLKESLHVVGGGGISTTGTITTVGLAARVVTIAQTLSVNQNTYVGGDIESASKMKAKNLETLEEITAGTKVYIKDTLSVADLIFGKKGITVEAAITGTTLHVGAVTGTSTLTVSNAVNFQDTLDVAAATTLATLTASGAVDFENTLDVADATKLASTLSVGGLSVLNTLSVENTAVISDLEATTVKVGDSLSVGGFVSGGVITGTGIYSTAVLTAANGIHSSQGVTIGSTLSTTGNIYGHDTIEANLQLKGTACLISNTLSVNGLTSLKNALIVEGATTLSNDESSATTIKATLSAKHIVTSSVITGTKLNLNVPTADPDTSIHALTVDGTTQLKKDVFINSDVTLDVGTISAPTVAISSGLDVGSASAGATTRLFGTLSVTQAAKFEKSVTIDETLSANSFVTSNRIIAPYLTLSGNNRRRLEDRRRRLLQTTTAPTPVPTTPVPTPVPSDADYADFNALVVDQGNTVLKGTLTVSGQIYGSSSILGASLSTGSAVIQNTLSVNGIYNQHTLTNFQGVELKASLSVYGTSNLGAVKISSTLSIAGNSILNGRVDIANLAVSGTTTFSGDTFIGNTQLVSGTDNFRRKLKERGESPTEVPDPPPVILDVDKLVEAIDALQDIGLLDKDRDKNVLLDKLKSKGEKNRAKNTGSSKESGWSFSKSDVRLKEHIEPLANRSMSILDLKGVSFRFKAKEEERPMDSYLTHFGFIAQDVRDIFPEMVREEKDGFLGLEYQSLIPLLVEQVKWQAREIEVLSSSQEALREEVHALVSSLNKAELLLSQMKSHEKPGVA